MNGEDQYILAVDTATPCSTVALTTGTRAAGKVLASLSVSSNVTHSRRLLVAIERLFTDSGISKERVTGYAVGLGPGSFTGLRIGLAMVKGLAAASGISIFGFSTLDVIVANCTSPKLICAVLDARKKEVYSAFYRCDEAGIARRVTETVVISPEKLAQTIAEPVFMVGDGLHSYKDYWQSTLGDNVTFAPAQHWSPSAATLGLLGGEAREMNLSLDVGSVVPLYVRASDAELSLKIPGLAQA